MSKVKPTDRELEIRKAAFAHGAGEYVRGSWPEPHRVSWAEQAYLSAIVAFKDGRHCAGWDLVETGDKLCGIGAPERERGATE